MSTSGKPFCPICLRIFEKKTDRDNHLAVIHRGDNSDVFRCEVCGKTYMSKVAVEYHQTVKHGGDRFECTICGNSFGHKSALKRHSKVHEENSDQFKCRKCDKSFGRKDQLMRHKQGVHNLVNFDLDEVDALKKDDEDTYTCKVCSKSFSGLDARYKIIDHLAKKCKDEKYYCDECEKSFSNVSNLNQHNRHAHVTIAVDVIKCDNCNFITKHKQSLLRHIKRKHSDKTAVERSKVNDNAMHNEKQLKNQEVVLKGQMNHPLSLLENSLLEDPVNQDKNLNSLKDGSELSLSDPHCDDQDHPMNEFDPVEDIQQTQPEGCLGTV